MKQRGKKINSPAFPPKHGLKRFCAPWHLPALAKASFCLPGLHAWPQLWWTDGPVWPRLPWLTLSDSAKLSTASLRTLTSAPLWINISCPSHTCCTSRLPQQPDGCHGLNASLELTRHNLNSKCSSLFWWDPTVGTAVWKFHTRMIFRQNRGQWIRCHTGPVSKMMLRLPVSLL